MMCDVLSIKSTQARYYAIDLGIAMQITNICRDVLIDYRGGRVYLPNTMLGDNEISSMTDAEILSVVTKLIKLADDYYNSALNGIKLIPIRSRFSTSPAIPSQALNTGLTEGCTGAALPVGPNRAYNSGARWRGHHEC